VWKRQERPGSEWVEAGTEVKQEADSAAEWREGMLLHMGKGWNGGRV
jgi:hypothetical protein